MKLNAAARLKAHANAVQQAIDEAESEGLVFYTKDRQLYIEFPEVNQHGDKIVPVLVTRDGLTWTPGTDQYCQSVWRGTPNQHGPRLLKDISSMGTELGLPSAIVLQMKDYVKQVRAHVLASL